MKLIRKLRLWARPRKWCGHCCVFCPWAEMCYAEFYGKEGGAHEDGE